MRGRARGEREWERGGEREWERGGAERGSKARGRELPVKIFEFNRNVIRSFVMIRERCLGKC